MLRKVGTPKTREEPTGLLKRCIDPRPSERDGEDLDQSDVQVLIAFVVAGFCPS
jgi:hypothetical protein